MTYRHMTKIVPKPPNEAERLARLREFNILDTPPSEAFDRIAHLASKILDMPITLVSLIDENRQWFKAAVGLDLNETSRDLAFCNAAIRGTDVMVVPDATTDIRFSDNPLVTGEPGIRFYAGAPLRTADGLNMGTLCVIDLKPRVLTKRENEILADLARIVVDEMELVRLAESEHLAQTRLIDAVEALPDGFVLYDKDDKLLLCNEKYREIYAATADLIVPGARFEDLLRAAVARGVCPDALGNEEEWIQHRLDRHRNPQDPIEQNLADGRWLRVEERRTREGGYVGFRIDITEMKNHAAELERLAATDHLTGALNRRRFHALAEAEFRRAQRYDSPMALCLIDADHFKALNDTYGHATGDCALQALVECGRQVLREQDFICRYGGEEFAILLPETGLLGAERAMERLRAAIEGLEFATNTGAARITASLGVTARDPSDESLQDTIARADHALYLAKISGRNRVVTAKVEPDALSPVRALA